MSDKLPWIALGGVLTYSWLKREEIAKSAGTTYRTLKRKWAGDEGPKQPILELPNDELTFTPSTKRFRTSSPVTDEEDTKELTEVMSSMKVEEPEKQPTEPPTPDLSVYAGERSPSPINFDHPLVAATLTMPPVPPVGFNRSQPTLLPAPAFVPRPVMNQTSVPLYPKASSVKPKAKQLAKQVSKDDEYKKKMKSILGKK